jgi:hypothetical protein
MGVGSWLDIFLKKSDSNSGFVSENSVSVG